MLDEVHRQNPAPCSNQVRALSSALRPEISTFGMFDKVLIDAAILSRLN
jgi:hypothetical protein